MFLPHLHYEPTNQHKADDERICMGYTTKS